MATRSRRLNDPLVVAVAGTQLYQVPAGRTLILRTIAFFNPGLVSSRCDGRIGIIPATQFVFADVDVAPGRPGHLDLEDDIILNPLDFLQAASVGGLCTAIAFGALLQGTPT